MKLKNIFFLLLSLFLLFLFPACVFNSREVTVSEVPDFLQKQYFRDEAFGENGLSFEAYNFLRGNLLQSDFTKNPDMTLKKLDEYFKISNDPKYYRIAANLCCYLAERSNLDTAAQFYISALQYCHLAITVQDVKGTKKNPKRLYDDFAEQLKRNYNDACCGIFKYLKHYKLLNKNSVTLLSKDGKKFILQKPFYDLGIPPEKIIDFSLCAEFKIKNLMQFNRQPGLGVPLVARVVPETAQLKSLRVPPGMTIPVTMMVHPIHDHTGNNYLQLVFLNTYLRETISLEKNENWQLALDFSTPLACFLSTLTERNLLSVMLDPLGNAKYEGLYMLEPYQPKKIPVLFIHGLMSSPETWVQMINSLKNDPVIRERYQFWFYYYSSGSPVFFSAYNLRNALLSAQKELCTTPEATRNFENMLIVGHSMGGLLTRTLVQEKPYYILEHITKHNIKELEKILGPEDMKTADRLVKLQPLPFVHRVIFMSVPHKGAEMAQSPIAKLGIWLIKLPEPLLSHAADIQRVSKRLSLKKDSYHSLNIFFTGIDNLDPENRYTQALGSSPMKKDLIYHSIIGNKDKDNIPGGSDGVVPYWSSHLDNAASELIVKSNHSVHRRPAAIREVMRILRLHLQTASN